MNQTEWQKKFAKQIRRKLAANNINQRELSERSGISEVTISRYIKCRRIPRVGEILKLAIALNCSVDELINFGELIE